MVTLIGAPPLAILPQTPSSSENFSRHNRRVFRLLIAQNTGTLTFVLTLQFLKQAIFPTFPSSNLFRLQNLACTYFLHNGATQTIYKSHHTKLKSFCGQALYGVGQPFFKLFRQNSKVWAGKHIGLLSDHVTPESAV